MVFFKKAFSELESGKPTLEEVSFKDISQEESRVLEILFTDLEIKSAVWDYKVSRSLGPYGYNFFIVRKCWEFMKTNIIKFVMDFHGNPKLNKSITSSFITLIPKNLNPQGLTDFRPIFLVGCLQKIISKVLASRIKGVLGNLISPC